MKFKNQVSTSIIPWFIQKPQSISEYIAPFNEVVQNHVRDIVEKGHTTVKHSIEPEVCESLIAEFKQFAKLNSEKFEQFTDQDGHYPRIINLHVVMPQLFELFSKNKIVYEIQKCLFGAEPALYTSLFYERGSGQPFHRDTPYFCTAPEYFYLGIWCALEDANEINGALQVIEGGHAVKELDRAAIGLKYFENLDAINPSSQELWNEYQALVTEQCSNAGLEKKQIFASAGDTIIWHPQLPHGGGPIQDMRKSRFSFVMHTTPLGVPVYHQDKFFNPKGEFSTEIDKHYIVKDGFHYLEHQIVDFGHVKTFPVSSFNVAK